MSVGTFRSTAKTHRHHIENHRRNTGASSATVASHPSLPDRSMTIIYLWGFCPFSITKH